VIALLVSVLCCAQAPERQQAVAMVIPPKGNLEIINGPVRADRDGVVIYLYPGDRVKVKEKQVALLFFADNHRERVKSGEVTIGPKGCEPVERVERLKPPGEKAVQVGLGELGPDSRIGAAVFRSDPGKLVTPFTGTTIISDRPALTWQPADKVDSYQVQLLKAGSKVEVWKIETKEPKLTYPQKEEPLQRGRKYVWKVTAISRENGFEGFADVVSSEFFVATTKVVEELEKVKPFAASNDMEELFLAAVAYEAKGCCAETLEIYEKLAKQVPEEIGFHRALAFLYERAGKKEKAKAERELVERSVNK
jgi:hypothetical protein